MIPSLWPRKSKIEAWPFRTRKAVSDLLAKYADCSEPDACWIWRGSLKKKDAPIIKMGVIDGRYRTCTVRHLSWWIKTDEHLAYPLALRCLCKNKDCINPAHMEKTNSRHERLWTDREVRNMRKEYWGRAGREGRHIRGRRYQVPIHWAAKHLGMDKNTLKRYLSGLKPHKKKWANPDLTDEEIQNAMAKGQRHVEEMQKKWDNRLSHRTMPITDNGSRSSLADMLRGATYKSAGGPTAPVVVRAPILEVIDDDEEELVEL